MKIFFFTFIVMFMSCNIKTVCNSKIVIDKIVLNNATEAGINYCEMVNKCLNGNIEAIREMYLSPKDYLDAGTLYLHFNYIYQITKEIGEERFITITNEFTKEEIEQLYFSIDLGVKSLGNGTSVQTEFPKLFRVLWNDTLPLYKKRGLMGNG